MHMNSPVTFVSTCDKDSNHLEPEDTVRIFFIKDMSEK